MGFIYLQISLTAGQASPQAEDYIGWAIITLLGLNLGYHFILIFVDFIVRLFYFWVGIFERMMNKGKEQ